MVGGAPPVASAFTEASTTLRPMTRATSAVVASRAIRDRTFGSSLSGWPSREAVRTYSMSRSRRCLTGEKVNMVNRSMSRAWEMY